MTQTEFSIAGVGGQGSILAGVILGTAAVTYGGKYAVQTQAYSSQQRGGFAVTWVIISDQPVMFPRVTHPDVLVAQAQDSINRFAHTLKADGVLIVDSDMIPTPPEDIEQVFKVPATSIARNRLKAPVTMNMVMLGALYKVTGVLSREALEKAIRDAVPQDKAQLNLDAFHLGFESV
ncbi:MAG: 2-oxoacid:acceptor oxidoreductase family protein [Desulfatiglandaceae bacterium]